MGANPAAAGGAPENPLFSAARDRGMKQSPLTLCFLHRGQGKRMAADQTGN